MARGAWQATVHGVTKSGTELSDYHFHFNTYGGNRKPTQEATPTLNT